MRIARGISIANTSKPISTAIVYDADAAAFFTAASITDTTQKNAVNQLVLDLKAASIWTKMKALYPVVGGVASSHAVNLKTPGTYNLSFATGWTHSSTGMTPNGATYANTNLIPSSVFNSTNYNHLAYYSRTNSAISFEYVMGASASGSNSMIIRRDNSLGYIFIDYSSGTSYRGASANVSDSRGLFLGSQKGIDIKFFKNNNVIGSNTFTSASLPLATNSIILGAVNDVSSVNGFTNKECSFASIGDGLTDAEASAFYTAVQNYQTTLGRQV